MVKLLMQVPVASTCKIKSQMTLADIVSINRKIEVETPLLVAHRD